MIKTTHGLAIGSVVFLAGCPVVPVETNQQACVRAITASTACLLESQLGGEDVLTDSLLEQQLAVATAQCALVPEITEDCDFRPMADCIEDLTCEDLITSQFDDTGSAGYCIEAQDRISGCGDMFGGVAKAISGS